MGDWIDRICQIDGETKLAQYRDDAQRLAELVGAPQDGLATLSQLVGVALGTQQRTHTGSHALTARQARLPYDQGRLSLFGKLIDALRESAPQNRPVPDANADRYRHLPFFEAYFSNFIEGTEFELDEAVDVIYAGKQIAGRADDSHDLTGTHRVVADLDEMSTTASSSREFLQLLRSRHATILAGRPEKNPGQFKETANRAGSSSFVLPGYVPGTLSAGWTRLAELDTPFERATYMMFLVAQVHPFDDGNGRLARVMMNAELVSAEQSRIIIPTVYREDYVGALKLLTRQDDASVIIKALRYAQDYTSQINFGDRDDAVAQLRQTNAFNEPNSDERLVLPKARSRGRD